jgi:hypothetical protein
MSERAKGTSRMPRLLGWQTLQIMSFSRFGDTSSSTHTFELTILNLNMTVLADNNNKNEAGIPVFMVGRSAENGREILPALAPDFDSTAAPNPCPQHHNVQHTVQHVLVPLTNITCPQPSNPLLHLHSRRTTRTPPRPGRQRSVKSANHARQQHQTRCDPSQARRDFRRSWVRA